MQTWEVSALTRRVCALTVRAFAPTRPRSELLQADLSLHVRRASVTGLRVYAPQHDLELEGCCPTLPWPAAPYRSPRGAQIICASILSLSRQFSILSRVNFFRRRQPSILREGYELSQPATSSTPTAVIHVA